MIATESDVIVLWRTTSIVSARVRDSDGVHDVGLAPLSGWTCSCPEPGPCAHLLAVQQLTEPAVAL